MDKNNAVKTIKNEVEIILNEYRINYVIGLDDNDIIIACTNKDTAQFIYANLKSRYNDKKYWEYTSEIFIKHDYIVHIKLY
jgi:hypothetical protein